MVWYYCEFCNMNVQIREGALKKCKTCGHFVHEKPLTNEERKRRKRERATYCEHCDLMVYAIPVELAMKMVQEETSYTANLIKNPPKEPYFVEDRRYKGGYRMTPAGECSCCLCSILCSLILIFIVIAIATYGIALIGLIPVLYYYKKKADKKKANLLKIQQEGQNLMNILYAISTRYRFVCRRCFNGVELNKAPKLQIDKKLIASQISEDNRSTRFCELCGTENKVSNKFCVYCGNEMRSLNSSNLEASNLLEKCESPIEVQFFIAAIKYIPNLIPQVNIGPYRVDFAVLEKKVVIELDGHDYHSSKIQRTKDAERQRYLQQNGYTVVRFTGTEIHNDVNKCVWDVLEILNKK